MMDYGIWKAVKAGLFLPIHKSIGIVENKTEKDWTKDKKENV